MGRHFGLKTADLDIGHIIVMQRPWFGDDIDHIDHENRITRLKKGRHVDAGRPRILQNDSIREDIVFFQIMKGVDAEALIAEDKVADADDADLFFSYIH